MINTLDTIEQKILNNERLTKEDGLALLPLMTLLA